MAGVLLTGQLGELGVKCADEDMITTAVTQMIETYLRRRVVLDTYTETLPGAEMVLLHAYPVEEIVSVTDAAGKSLSYQIEMQEGVLRIIGTPPDRVKVVYRGGYDEMSMPMPIKYAAAILAQGLQKAVESGGQILMSERLSDYQVMYYNASGSGSGNTSAIAPAAMALLAPYKGRWM